MNTNTKNGNGTVTLIDMKDYTTAARRYRCSR